MLESESAILTYKRMDIVVTHEQKMSERALNKEIRSIEVAMRTLFFGNRIDSDVITQYLTLERRWKHLTKYNIF
jgi:hypothetical protein